VPIAAGVAAAGFIGGTMYLMDDAHKRGIAAGNAAAAAGEHAKSFSDSFASVATGGGPAGGTGGAAGATAAEDTIKKQVGIRKAIVDKNKQKGKDTIAREAYAVIAQAIYDNAKTKYREQHKGDFWVGVGEVVGIEDFGSGLGAHMKPIAIVLENKSPGGGPLKLNG